MFGLEGFERHAHCSDGVVGELASGEGFQDGTVAVTDDPLTRRRIEGSRYRLIAVDPPKRVFLGHERDASVLFDFSSEGETGNVVQYPLQLPGLAFVLWVVGTLTVRQLGKGVHAGIALTGGIPRPLQLGESMQLVGQVVEMEAVCGFDPCVQDPVTPFHDRVVGRLAWTAENQVDP